MGECYYIGKRKRRIKRPLLCFFILLCVVALGVNARLRPQVMALVESRVTSRLSSVTASKIAEVLDLEKVSYDDLIHIAYDTAGAVRSVSVDTVKITLLKQKLALALLSSLQKEEGLAISVPLGNLIGFLPLSGQGPDLPVSLTAAESLRASFSSSFTEAGINQTRHTVSFCFEITVYCLFSGRTREITFLSSFPAAETIIVGDVPDTLTQISRLTDGITEYDIDDAVDFGNILG